MNEGRRVSHRLQSGLLSIDWLLLGIVVVLCLVGLGVAYSSTSRLAYELSGDVGALLKRQAIWVGIGLSLAVAASWISYHHWMKLSIPLMVVTLALLMLRVLGLRESSSSVGLATWATLTTVVYIAHWLSSKRGILLELPYGLLPFNIMIGIVVGLFMIEADVAAGLLVVLVAAVIFYIAGADIVQLLIGAIGGAAAFTFVVQQFRDVSEIPNTLWTGLGKHSNDLALAALGSGGIFGKGLGNGHIKDTVPQLHLQATLAAVGEDLGLIGCLAVLVLFVMLFYRGIMIAQRANDSFGTLLAIGITSFFMIQTSSHLGSLARAIPLPGMQLPFVSYGGASSAVFLVAAGVLMNISRSSMKRTFVSIPVSNAQRSCVGRLIHVVSNSPWSLLVTCLILTVLILHGFMTVPLSNLGTLSGQLNQETPEVPHYVLVLLRSVFWALVTLLSITLVAFRAFGGDPIRLQSWESVTEDCLRARGWVRSRTFGPQGSELLASYLKSNEHLDLILDARYLRYRDLKLKQHSERMWERAHKLQSIKAELPREDASQLLEVLVSALDLTCDTRSVAQNEDFHVALLNIAVLFAGLRVPNQVPILIPRSPKLTEKQLSLIPRLSRSLSLEAPNIALLIAWSTDQVQLTAETLTVERLRRAQAFDLVLLGLDEMQRLVLARYRHRLFRQKLLGAIDLTTVSPFIITGCTPDDMFFGRENELREIVEHIAVHNYAVIGGRRIGKTSLLTRLHRVRLSETGLTTVYHDCSATPTYDALLAAAIRDVRRGPVLAPASTLGELLQHPVYSNRLILLLDEADKLVPVDRDKGWPFFNALRAATCSTSVQVILSGERALRDALRHPASPLFNLANEVLLGPLNFSAARELVTQPMRQLEIELMSENRILESIWDFTSGHPNIIQRLCHRLIEQLGQQGDRRITRKDVDEIIADPDFQRNDFLSTYWEAATSLEKIISLLMADDEDVCTLRTVRQALTERCDLQPRAREVDDALQRLVDLRSILRRTPTGYEFAVGAFPRVIAGTVTLADMLEILTEEYEEQGE